MVRFSFFSLYFVLATTFLIAQETKQFSINEYTTKNNIPFVEILFNKNGGTIANENGKLFINKTNLIKYDTLTFICMGYKTKHVQIKDLLLIDTIFLDTTFIKLPEIVVSNEKIKEIIIGNKKKGGCQISGYTGTEYVLKLYAPNNNSGYLQKIGVYVTKKGYPSNPFRLKLYKVDKIGSPGELIETKDILMQASKGDEWVYVDVAEYFIYVNEVGVFASVQWLPEGKDHSKTSGAIQTMESGHILGASLSRKTDRTDLVFRKYLGDKEWKNDVEWFKKIDSNFPIPSIIGIIK